MKRTLLLFATLVVAAAPVFSPAVAAKPKPKAKPFAPKLGNYTGTATSPDGVKAAITGQVYKQGKTTYVRAIVTTPVKCPDGGLQIGNVALSAVLKGKRFSATEPGAGSQATSKVSGSFSSAKAFAGTASKVVENRSVNPSVICESGSVSFSLKLK